MPNRVYARRIDRFCDRRGTKMLRASKTLQLRNDTRRPNPLSTKRLNSRATRLTHFAPKIRCKHFHRSTHFIQTRPHTRSNSVCQSVFAHHNPLATWQSRSWLGSRYFVEIVGGE